MLTCAKLWYQSQCKNPKVVCKSADICNVGAGLAPARGLTPAREARLIPVHVYLLSIPEGEIGCPQAQLNLPCFR
jgi:hypothetical protein